MNSMCTNTSIYLAMKMKFISSMVLKEGGGGVNIILAGFFFVLFYINYHFCLFFYLVCNYL